MNNRYIKIKEFAEVVTGGTPNTKKSEYWSDGNIPWLPSGACKDSTIYKSDTFITQLGLDNSSAKMMPKGTVIIALTGATTGKLGILGIDACANQSVTGIIPNENFINKYLFYYLKSIREKILNDSYGGAQKHISQGYVKDIEVFLPDLMVQEKIANVLDKAQQLIDKRKEQIEVLDELVKSRFIEMFGDPVTNPKGWKYPKIEEVVENEKNAIKAGPFGSALKKEYYVDSGYKIYGQEQVISGDVNFGDYYISEEKYRELENCAVKSNDVLISLVGTYGKLLIIPETFEAGIINPRLMKIAFNKDIVNTIYFKYFFQSESLRNKLSDNTHGGTMPILNVGIVKNINIPVPPIELQNQFVDFVKQVDKLKSQMETSLKELEDNFNSLMQKAFKGELF